MNQVIDDDYRNSGFEVSVRRQLRSCSVIIYDLEQVPGNKSSLDVFRLFLQFAEKMKYKDFSEVKLAYRGNVKFKIRGSYFKKLGQEYNYQNVLYTIRTFPENLLTPDGRQAYSKWSGGMIGVFRTQLKDSNDFFDKWYRGSL